MKRRKMKRRKMKSRKMKRRKMTNLINMKNLLIDYANQFETKTGVNNEKVT